MFVLVKLTRYVGHILSVTMCDTRGPIHVHSSNSTSQNVTEIIVSSLCLSRIEVAGRSSVDSVPAFEAVGRRIDPSQWTQLQFGLFSVPTSGPQLVYQSPWYVLFCLWKSAYKRSLAAYRKE